MPASRRFAIVLIVTVCALLAAVIAGTGALRTSPADRSGLLRRGSGATASIAMDTPLGATEVEREIAQLIAEYLADQPAADARYRGKTVAVSGVVLGVDRRDPPLVTVVVGKQPGSKESPCACQGGPRLDRAAAALSPGQPITVRGKFAGMVMLRMVLLNCEIVEQ
ncbi:MAG TPA: hypothetical protein VHN14_13075 [Kofleriaceae bacterium]|jgi:hypothetical protein|nr:hypothetical protein [Kofleriaceae bacterium]